MQKGEVFQLTISNGQTMFGVVTNTIKNKGACNIYSFAGSPQDAAQAMARDILIHDLMISGAEFTKGRWKPTGHMDQSVKAEIRDPFFVFGIPPAKLIRIDDPDYARPLTDPDEIERLLNQHMLLSFNFPEGNETIIEEAYLYGRRHLAGQHLTSSSPEELLDFYNREAEHMSDFQRRNVVARWGSTLGLDG